MLTFFKILRFKVLKVNNLLNIRQMIAKEEHSLSDHESLKNINSSSDTLDPSV